MGFLYTAISRKVVGKSARDNHERYCGQFRVHCSSKKFERIVREALDICLRVLKESNKSRFDNYRVSNSELIISHITQGLQILLMSGVGMTSASQILESFCNVWGQVSQRKKPFSDFPARVPGMYTLS